MEANSMFLYTPYPVEVGLKHFYQRGHVKYQMKGEINGVQCVVLKSHKHIFIELHILLLKHS